jgi:lipoprotein-anchoring transpeptidase ErfK/SrfK
MNRRLLILATAIAAAFSLGAVVAASAGPARGPRLTLHWQAPTPRDGAAFTAIAGEPFTLELAAAGAGSNPVIVRRRHLPQGATLAADYGQPGLGTVTWTPSAQQVGEHVLSFVARTNAGSPDYAQPRSFVVFVKPATEPGQYEPFSLSGPNGMSRWAELYQTIAARSGPSSKSKRLVRLKPWTPEGTSNLVLALGGVITKKHQYWVKVRLPILPNGSTGWVPRPALGPFHNNYTRLVIDRELFRATLYRRGQAIFTSHVGVGKSYWPTPAGEYYVRERITGFSDLIYGPIAFGTNARSNVLTDWPGGGFIGIHGTNQPGILPGRVSHGCVRMPNAAVKRLSRLMPLGTPVTIN